jgi:hypothetical protein
LAIGASVVVVAVVAVLVIVKASGGSSAESTARTPVSATVMGELNAVPVSTLVAAAEAASPSAVNPPTNLPTTVPALASGGKAEVLYVGAEYCPFCAAERWPMVMALSKFGTFTNLVTTKSSATDTNPNTPTFTFVGSTYTSPYLTFVPVETLDRNSKPLQTPTAAEQKLLTTYDAPPYVSSQAGSIPFVLIGNKFVVSGTEYDGSAIAGKSVGDAATYLTSASNPTSRAAEAVAGRLIGAICKLTGDQPASVCSAVPASLQTGQSTSGNQGSSSSG